jgi:hydroxyethylthiazole kinase
MSRMSDTLPTQSTGVVTIAAELLRGVRAAPPLTHSITNAVVTGFTANVLLALGAAPAMVDITGEAGMFAAAASGVLINLGTPTPEQRQAAREAAAGATDAGTPWVLDPVAIGVLTGGTRLAHELAALHPTTIRGNASEILALAGLSTGGRGVDATDEPEAALDAARALAARHGSVVAVSGAVDLITDGNRIIRIANGHALLTRVTGGGCALGSVMAAFLGTARGTGISDLDATASATLVYTLAAEHAARASDGPGSFAVALLDALAAIEPEDIAPEARVEERAL